MFNFDTSDIQRIAVSSIGAIALSAACVIAAAGPVKAATPNAPLTVADWQQQVERKIDGAQERDGPSKLAQAVVAVRFTADGDFAGAGIARSSGDRSIDRRAVRIAQHVSYPALPVGLRGTPRMVEMHLYFGKAANDVDYAAMQDQAAKLARIAKADRPASDARIAAR